jgi:hypothetical protein
LITCGQTTDLHSDPPAVGVGSHFSISTGVQWGIGEGRRVWVGETEAKRPLARPDVDGRVLGWESDDWINLAQVMYKCRVLVNTVMVP